MKTFIMVAALIAASVIGINAQEKYVGFQYVNTNPDINYQANPLAPKNDDFYGAVGSYTKYTKYVGLNGEASANFGGGRQPSQIYTLTGGVTLNVLNFKNVRPFVKGNVGVGYIHTNKTVFGPSDSDVSGAYKVSTGIDVGTGKVKFRLIEAGYLRTNFYGQRQDNLVLSSGIVF